MLSFHNLHNIPSVSAVSSVSDAPKESSSKTKVKHCKTVLVQSKLSKTDKLFYFKQTQVAIFRKYITEPTKLEFFLVH